MHQTEIFRGLLICSKLQQSCAKWKDRCFGVDVEVEARYRSSRLQNFEFEFEFESEFVYSESFVDWG
jgi:hypothetical protein